MRKTFAHKLSGSIVLSVGAFLLALFPVSASAAPSISGTSGTWSHGGTVTVNGSAFGTKSTAAPLVWDDATGATLLDKWDGKYPNCSVDHRYDTNYTAAIRGIGMPHARATKYIAGAHGSTGSANSECGYDVGFWKHRPQMAGYPAYTYFSYYFRVDDNFVFGLNDGDNNFKMASVDQGHVDALGSPFTMSVNIGVPYTPPGSPQYVIYSTNERFDIPDLNGHSGYWNFNGNDWWGGGWTKVEYEYKHSTPGTDGWLKVWEDGRIMVDYRGRFGLPPPENDTIQTHLIGGYSRNYQINTTTGTNWRYYADVYYDTSAARVLLCQNNTYASRGICENQRPTSWSSTSAVVTVNAGRFANASTAYLYVCDSTGSCNSSGTPIVIASGGGDTTPPAAPTGLAVQ